MIKVHRIYSMNYNPQEHLNSYKMYKMFCEAEADFFEYPEAEANKLIRKKYLAERKMIKELFKNAGWEGDGKLALIWLPQFLNIGIDDGWGVLIWYVKRYNNAISFLGIDDSIEFPENLFRFCD